MIIIYSIPYDYSIKIPQDKAYIIPLVQNALDLDSIATVIPIPNKVVTPELLDLVNELIITLSIPTTVLKYLNNSTIKDGIKYLGIEVLHVVFNCKYNIFVKKFPLVNLLDKSTFHDKETYKSLLRFSIDYNVPFLLNYILDYIPSGTYPGIDNNMFLCACETSQMALIKPFLARGINPSIHGNRALFIACYNNYIDLFQLLLNNPRINPSFLRSVDYDGLARSIVGVIVCRGHIELLDLLIKDSRVNLNINDNEGIRFAIYIGRIDIAQRLWQDPKVKATYIPTPKDLLYLN